MSGLHEGLSALLAKELQEDAEASARAERGNVRCLVCDLRYEERQDYGCHLGDARAHRYDEDELDEAAERGRKEPSHVTLSVGDLRQLLAQHSPEPIKDSFSQVVVDIDFEEADRG